MMVMVMVMVVGERCALGRSCKNPNVGLARSRK